MSKFNVSEHNHNVKNLMVNFIIKIVSIITILILNYGCQKDVDIYQDLPYLELSFSLVDAPSFLIDSHDIAIIDEARSRMDQYVKFVNNRFTLSINSGEKISISNDLFNALKSNLEETNKRIVSKELIIDENGLKINRDKLKLYSLKKDLPNGQTGDKVHIEVVWRSGWGWGSGLQVTLSHEATLLALAGGSTVGILAPDPTVSKIFAIVGIWGAAHYTAFGGSKGIIIIENGPFLPPTIYYQF